MKTNVKLLLILFMALISFALSRRRKSKTIPYPTPVEIASNTEGAKGYCSEVNELYCNTKEHKWFVRCVNGVIGYKRDGDETFGKNGWAEVGPQSRLRGYEDNKNNWEKYTADEQFKKIEVQGSKTLGVFHKLTAALTFSGFMAAINGNH